MTSNDEVESERHIEMVTETLPASENHIEQYRQAQFKDEICSQVIYNKVGWPRKHQIGLLHSYWKVRDSFTLLPQDSHSSDSLK